MTRKERRWATLPTAHPTGYICKRCENPSPVGVGYAVTEAHLIEDNAHQVKECPCGYSQSA